MPSSSRIVFAEDLVGAAPWQPRTLEGERRAGAERRMGLGRRADDPQSRLPPTYEDGLSEGMARGVVQARRESADAQRAQLEALAQRADGLIAALTAQLAALQQSVADEVTGLAVEIARSAVGGALRIRPELVGPVVAEALAAIADEHGKPVVRLHPDDAVLIEASLAPALAARGAQLVPDPALTPGGCRIETGRAGVDATLQTRWRRALAAIGRDDEWVDA
jgi:flagellar assembly protein FliH